MLLVGLTGGIGSGKSTVARLLGEHGAVIVDADVFAREAVGAGSDAFAAVVERFGDEVVGPDGELDRPKLASIVFADRAALADLEAIVHPEVRRMIADGIQAELDTDHVVVLVNPLLIEMGAHRDCDVVVVISADPETQVAQDGGARHGRGRRPRAAGRAAARSRSAPGQPTCCSTTRAPSRISRPRSTVLWTSLAARAAGA